MNKSVFSFSMSANNVTLLSFAAERRRLLQQSIDDRLPAGPTTANRPKESLYRNTHTHTHTHTHSHLTALCPGLPRWAGTRKVKAIWILLKQETVSGSGISWTICKSAPRSRQITTPAPHHSVFYRPDALPAAQQTTSMHWRPKESPYRNRCRNSKIGLPNQYRILPKHNVNTPTLLLFWCMHVILLKMYMVDTSRNKPNFLLNWELLFTTKHKGGRRKSPRGNCPGGMSVSRFWWLKTPPKMGKRWWKSENPFLSTNPCLPLTLRPSDPSIQNAIGLQQFL